MYHLVRMLFLCGWKRLGLKYPGGRHAWRRTVKLLDSLPEEERDNKHKHFNTAITEHSIAHHYRHAHIKYNTIGHNHTGSPILIV